MTVSPDGTYAAIAIENERDEDFNDGLIPQLPAGFLVVMDVSDVDPGNWTFESVNLTDLENVLYSSDPEPEYVAINTDNVCVVTLQENNAIVLVDLPTLTITAIFSAGTPTVDMVDVAEDGIIDQQSGSVEVPREPDAVTWIGTTHFATANEGDLNGGSRGFSIFDTSGEVVYDSGNEMEWWTARIGQYPEGRSEAKGNEPEGILYAEFGDVPYLFVLSERSSVVFGTSTMLHSYIYKYMQLIMFFHFPLSPSHLCWINYLSPCFSFFCSIHCQKCHESRIDPNPSNPIRTRRRHCYSRTQPPHYCFRN